MEMMVVVTISAFIFAAVFAVFVLGKNTWTTGGALIELQQEGRRAMDKMIAELSKAEVASISYPNCAAGNSTCPEIRFQIPIQDNNPVAGSIYNESRNLKLGAYARGAVTGITGATIRYYKSGSNLMRHVYKLAGTDYVVTQEIPPANQKNRYWAKFFDRFGNKNLAYAAIYIPPYCGDGKCNGGETCSTCPDCGTCPPAVDETSIIASNVNQLNFIREVGTLANKDTIKIQLALRKVTGGRPADIYLTSTVVARNIATEYKLSIPTPGHPNINDPESLAYFIYRDASTVGPLPPPVVCGKYGCQPGENTCNCPADCGPWIPCFLPGTPILLANGKTIPIEDIKVGDEVTSFDEKNHQFTIGKVNKLLIHKTQGYLIINGHLKVTPHHRVYSNGKWVRIGKLKVGDNLFTSQGKPEKITSIEKKPEAVTVYNFHVSPFRTYIAGGYVVHNAKAACCGQGGCEYGETWTSCPQDCTSCGNGKCDAGEDSCSCCSDCCGGSCFLAGTPIILANGKTIPIENIKVGDEVMSFDEAGKRFVKDKVTKLLRHKAEGYLIINGQLKVTPEHRFYIEGKWKNIGALKIGDELFTGAGKTEKITSIRKVKEKVKVYNFKVSPYRTYIAGGYVVHNSKLPGSDPCCPCH